MGVPLRRGEGRVAEHLLDDAEVGAAVEEVGGAGVAESVGMEIGAAHGREAVAANEELDHAIRQIISRSVASDEVIDIFAAAGLKKPDISILSDEFLMEVRDMPLKNVAVELLRLPYLKIMGALLLGWIAIKLLIFLFIHHDEVEIC